MTDDSGLRAMMAEQQRLEQRVRELDRKPYAEIPGREGGPPVEDIIRAERSALRRLNPRRDRWPELREFEGRIVTLQARQTEVTDRLVALRDQRSSAPAREADALARWELDGREGPRPQGESERIDAEIREAQAEYEGLTVAQEHVLEEKAQFVERHRGRLLKTAEASVREAHKRLLSVIGDLEDARGELVDARRDVLYALLYPENSAGSPPPVERVAGGLRKPVMETLGLDVQVAVEGLLRLIRADADWLTVAATPEQRKRLTEADELDGASWVGSDKHREQIRAEKKRARRRHEEEWGTKPDEFGWVS